MLSIHFYSVFRTKSRGTVLWMPGTVLLSVSPPPQIALVKISSSGAGWRHVANFSLKGRIQQGKYLHTGTASGKEKIVKFKHKILG
jgi:hypothetical protein